jgi:hypothetical protein
MGVLRCGVVFVWVDVGKRVDERTGQMAANGAVHRRRIPRAQRVEDGLVLGLFAGQPPPPGRGAALHPGAEQPDAKAAIGGGQQGVVSEIDQAVVELTVESEMGAVAQGPQGRADS